MTLEQVIAEGVQQAWETIIIHCPDLTDDELVQRYHEAQARTSRRSDAVDRLLAAAFETLETGTKSPN